MASPDSPAGLIKQASVWSIIWGFALMIFGFLCIDSPQIAALAVNVFLGWIIMFVGVIHLVLAFHAHRAGSLIWKLLVGVAYILFGIYIVTHPLIAVAVLTLLLAILFLVEGVLDIIMYFKMRSTNGAVWVLLDGIVTIFLGGLIYVHWPSSSWWAIGTLVGVSMIMSGITRIMLSLAVRKVAKQFAT
jgi:uncharacterized membrane protein HdeD (DUF308 family)